MTSKLQNNTIIKFHSTDNDIKYFCKVIKCNKNLNFFKINAQSWYIEIVFALSSSAVFNHFMTIKLIWNVNGGLVNKIKKEET